MQTLTHHILYIVFVNMSCDLLSVKFSICRATMTEKRLTETGVWIQFDSALSDQFGSCTKEFRTGYSMKGVISKLWHLTLP